MPQGGQDKDKRGGQAVSSSAPAAAAEIRRRLFEEVEEQVKQHQVKQQELVAARGLEKPSAVAYINQESRSLTPSRRLQDAARFHQPATPRQTSLTPKQVPYSAREAVRFHRDGPPALGGSVRSLGSEKVAAGSAVTLQKRRDMPPDTPGSRGRARSMTPEYHNRYSRNTVGTSLPGACTAVPQPPPTPSGQRRVPPAFDPRGSTPFTPSSQSQAVCRFHYAKETPRGPARMQSQAFCFSSAEAKPTAGLAGSLRGANSAMRPSRRLSTRAEPPAPWREYVP